MKIVAIASMLCFFGIHVFAQDKLPDFGEIDNEDLTMQICSFDPEATAMYLIDKGIVTYSFLGNSAYVETDYRERLKILKEKGIAYANVKVNYYSKDHIEEISKVEGYVFNIDSITGNVTTTKLEKTAIYDRPLNANYSTIAIAFPNVKVGSVIEFRYHSEKRSNNMTKWVFQKGIPCRYSEFTIFIPSYFGYTVQTTTRQLLETKATNERADGRNYIMRNIPALKAEPYMASINDYLQRVDFQLSSYTPQGGVRTDMLGKWSKITDDLLAMESFGRQLKKNLSNTEELDAKLKTMNSDLEKMKAIYRYVQTNMESNGERIFFSPNGIKDAWDKKRGSVGDINLILINLLENAKVKVYPILVSTKTNGHVNIAYPSLAQFNEVLAYVPISGKEYILNAAEKYSPYNLIPNDIQSTQGFVVDKDKNLGWIVMQDLTQKSKNIVTFQANMDATGKVTGDAIIYSAGYSRTVRLTEFKKDILKTWLGHTGFKIDKVEVNQADDDTIPLKQTIDFSDNVEKSGDYFFLPYNVYLGLVAKNPFTAENRQSAIDFNYLQEYNIVGSYTIPEGFAFEELPKNKQLILADTSISIKRKIEANGNKVNFTLSLYFTRHQYDVDEYASIKEFYKKMFALLDEKIVVKKK